MFMSKDDICEKNLISGLTAEDIEKISGNVILPKGLTFTDLCGLFASFYKAIGDLRGIENAERIGEYMICVMKHSKLKGKYSVALSKITTPETEHINAGAIGYIARASYIAAPEERKSDWLRGFIENMFCCAHDSVEARSLEKAFLRGFSLDWEV